MTRRSSPRSSVRRYWSVARGSFLDTMAHRIWPGERVFFVSAGWKRTVCCEACAKANYDEVPPDRPFVFRSDAPEDFRSRQSGDD